ncbi:DUF6445 family protein [Paraglaciecola sp. L3A3]|uniref:DUF6445 family protein n=1 Tax=Paraglaciecola sp. L3A3 TaxID=2686358 RepID=UPI00351A9C48
MKNSSYLKRYFTKSTNHFELIQVINYMPNRLAAYPTSILHIAFIENQQKERLTTNILFISLL